MAHVKTHTRKVRRKSKLAKEMPGGPTFKYVKVHGHHRK